MTATTVNSLQCLRPMPQTGTQDRELLRGRDNAICLCGRSSCRDHDLWLKREEKA